VTTFVNINITIINLIATTEFGESGDFIDLAILRIPFLTNFFNPLGGLNNDLNQSDAMWNKGNLTGSLTNDIMASPVTLNSLLSSTQSIQASATEPNF
jgi:hypothetical protein